MTISQTIDEAGSNTSSSTKEKAAEMFRRLGPEASAPFLDLLSKYREPARDVLQAVADGFNAAAKELGSREDGKVRKVAEQFTFGAEWIQQANSILKQDDGSTNIVDLIEREGARHPEAVFALSLIGGVVLGRIGRYTVEKTSIDSNPMSSTAAEPGPTLDEVATSCPIDTSTAEAPQPSSELEPQNNEKIDQGGSHGAA
jgi:hypothetical protein